MHLTEKFALFFHVISRLTLPKRFECTFITCSVIFIQWMMSSAGGKYLLFVTIVIYSEMHLGCRILLLRLRIFIDISTDLFQN